MLAVSVAYEGHKEYIYILYCLFTQLVKKLFGRVVSNINIVRSMQQRLCIRMVLHDQIN